MVNYLQYLGRLCSNHSITAIVEIIRPWARNRGVLYTINQSINLKFSFFMHELEQSVLGYVEA